MFSCLTSPGNCMSLAATAPRAVAHTVACTELPQPRALSRGKCLRDEAPASKALELPGTQASLWGVSTLSCIQTPNYNVVPLGFV